MHLAVPERHLLVSGLPQDAGATSALGKLLAVGRREAVDMDWITTWRDQQALPAAQGEHWLRADPVHCLLMRDHLVLDDPAHLGLQAEEARQLLETINQHFALDGLRFFAPHPQRWYVRLERAPQLSVCPLAEAMGKSVADLLPSGAEAVLWRQRLNEAQMLLHEHPVNQVREAHDLAEVNSLWLYLPPPAPAGLQTVEPQQLEQGCAVLLQALRKGELAALNLYFVNEMPVLRCRVQRRDLWKFWRRRRAWGDWIG